MADSRALARSTPVPLPAAARALASRPTAALVAAATGGRLPAYVDVDQAHAIVNAAETTAHRLLLKALWQSGGRVTEVLHLRAGDVDRAEGALRLTNLKQRRRSLRQKTVYVSADLVGELAAFARDHRLRPPDYFFRSRESGGEPMCRQHAWRLIQRYSRAAGVFLLDPDTGQLRPASGLDFRHGAAVHQLRSGVPLSEVSEQLGHARIDTTLIYTKLANAERRSIADRVSW